jgi:phosphate transport system substrate-binding protein
VEAFVEFYIENSTDIAEQALFVPLTTAQQDQLKDQLAKLKAGAKTTTGPTTTSS